MAQRLNSCLGVPQEEILQAFHENNLQLFIDLINEDDIDINHEYKEENFSTLLHLSLVSRKYEFVRELLRRGADVNHCQKVILKYPLHVAAENGLLNEVHLLLRVGADPNCKMENGSTPLHLAAARSGARWLKEDQDLIEVDAEEMKFKFVRITQLLVNTVGINIDCRNNLGITPLYFAVTRGTEEVAKVFEITTFPSFNIYLKQIDIPILGLD